MFDKVKAVPVYCEATVDPKVGNVDGVFADHANNNPKHEQGKTYAEFCNGKGAGRKCFLLAKFFYFFLLAWWKVRLSASTHSDSIHKSLQTDFGHISHFFSHPSCKLDGVF